MEDIDINILARLMVVQFYKVFKYKEIKEIIFNNPICFHELYSWDDEDLDKKIKEIQGLKDITHIKIDINTENINNKISIDVDNAPYL